MNTKTKLQTIAVAAILLTMWLAIAPSFASDRDVPLFLIKYRDRLLDARNARLAELDEVNRCMNEDEATIRQIGGMLSTNPTNRQALLDERERRIQCIKDHLVKLAWIRDAMIFIDKELVDAEGDIKDYACMK